VNTVNFLPNLSPAQNELFQRVDEVLHDLWDPIGVSGVPQAPDEYDSYVPQVFTLLNRGSDASDIAAFLSRTTSHEMGLTVNSHRDLEVAEVLCSWREHVFSA
jgi:hypothetical protein